MTPTDNIHSLAAPYALHALDDIEALRFERHLDEGCETCLNEVVGFVDTAAALGLGEEIPISDELRAHAATVPDVVRQVGPARAPRPVGRLTRHLTSVAAAVLAVAVVGLSVVTVSQRNELGDLRDDAVVAAILQQDDAIAETAQAGAGTLRVVASPSGGTGAILASGLAEAPNGHAYQLWLIDGDNGAISAGFLDVGPDGTGRQLMQGDMSGVVAIGVTVEPTGGSPTPTTDPVAVVELSA